MSYMIEVSNTHPMSGEWREAIEPIVKHFDGLVSFEESAISGITILTIEFDTADIAEHAMAAFQSAGFYVEGPSDYGDS